MIPRRLVRTVPTETSAEVEAWWDHACDLHPRWECLTLRDPLDAADFPATASVWPLATSGAQLAGLIRLDYLYAHGAIYLDSDVELFRPLDPLLQHHAFAAYEDDFYIPDAVLGAEAGHPAIRACLELAVALVGNGAGASASGPRVTTAVLKDRDDVTILPRESFFPIGYWEKDRLDGFTPGPDNYGLHHWAFSWAGKP